MSGAKEAREKGLQVREKYGGQWGWSGVTMVEGDEARGDRGQAMERMGAGVPPLDHGDSYYFSRWVTATDAVLHR